MASCCPVGNSESGRRTGSEGIIAPSSGGGFSSCRLLLLRLGRLYITARELPGGRSIWAEELGITIQHIQHGQPQQNAYIERYNRTVRHEWLDQHIIEAIEEAQDFATQWLWTYNNDRPNMGIGGITPAQKLKMAA